MKALKFAILAALLALTPSISWAGAPSVGLQELLRRLPHTGEKGKPLSRVLEAAYTCNYDTMKLSATNFVVLAGSVAVTSAVIADSGRQVVTGFDLDWSRLTPFRLTTEIENYLGNYYIEYRTSHTVTFSRFGGEKVQTVRVPLIPKGLDSEVEIEAKLVFSLKRRPRGRTELSAKLLSLRVPCGR